MREKGNYQELKFEHFLVERDQIYECENLDLIEFLLLLLFHFKHYFLSNYFNDKFNTMMNIKSCIQKDDFLRIQL